MSEPIQREGGLRADLIRLLNTLGWERPWREMGRKFRVSILLGLLVEGLFVLTHEMTPLPELRRLGTDLVLRAVVSQAAPYKGAIPRLVLVNVDDRALSRWNKANGEKARPEIIAMIEQLRASKARLVVVDISFLARPEHDSALQRIMAADGVPVVAIASLERPEDVGDTRELPRLSEDYEALWLRRLPKLQLATGELTPDDDGQVRSRVSATCVDAGDQTIILPGVAEAVAMAMPPELQKHARALNCDPAHPIETEPIFFVQQWPLTSGPLRRGFREFPASDVAPGMAEFEDAIVLVGQTHGLSRDSAATPVGRMPGVVIHLNAIAGLLLFGEAQEPPRWKVGLMLVAAIILVACINQIYWLFHEGFIRDRATQPSLHGVALSLIDLVIFVVVTVLSVRAAIWLLVAAGANLLSQGMIIGTVAPAFAVVLEAAMEIGKPLLYWLGQLVSPGGRAVGSAVFLALWVPGVARASGDQVEYRVQPEGGTRPEDIQIERRIDNGFVQHSGASSLYLEAGDIVRVVRERLEATILAIPGNKEIGRVRYRRALIVPVVGSTRERQTILGGTYAEWNNAGSARTARTYQQLTAAANESMATRSRRADTLSGAVAGAVAGGLISKPTSTRPTILDQVEGGDRSGAGGQGPAAEALLGGSSATEITDDAGAMDVLLAHGYGSITRLRREADGLWRAETAKVGARRGIAVDALAHVVEYPLPTKGP